MTRLLTNTVADEAWLSELEAIERDFPEWIDTRGPSDDELECDCGVCSCCPDPGVRR